MARLVRVRVYSEPDSSRLCLHLPRAIGLLFWAISTPGRSNANNDAPLKRRHFLDLHPRDIAASLNVYLQGRLVVWIAPQKPLTARCSVLVWS
jgi:hypothetical protein